MKVCVYIRCQAGADLHTGNLRSEPRCERLMLEAVSQCDWVTEVYTMGCSWEGGAYYTSKYRGSITPEQQPEKVLVMQDWGWLPDNHNFKGYIVGIYAGPQESQIQEITDVFNRCDGRFSFTCGYPDLFFDKEYRNRLDKFLPSVCLLPEPRITASRFANRFGNKTILFSRRLVFMNWVTESPYMQWALKKLREDESLNVRVLTGCSPEEVNDLSGDESFRVVMNVNKYFWENENIKPFSDVKPRVSIEYCMDWSQVLDVYASSKLLADSHKYHGGPGPEAAMHGVPFVGTNKSSGALCKCPDYLTGDSEAEIFSTFDRLMEDEKFYSGIAKSYNSYALDTYSFKSYSDNLFEVVQKIGAI